jgi:peroxiredoxin/predicted 2-oxoglutarate/Fe(II)-dependent dioxygenase YbiX
MAEKVRLQVGAPAPWFQARSPGNERFHFNAAAGRYVVLCFFGSAADPASRRVLDDIARGRDAFDDVRAAFFGVSIDPEDERSARVAEASPGIHLFWDFDRAVSRLYGAAAEEGDAYRRFSVVLDERLRVFAIVPFDDESERHAPRVLEALAALPPLGQPRITGIPAPVLIVPRIFEPELCRALIAYYEAGGAGESGFMREIDGRTVAMHDPEHKRRRDKRIDDERLRDACMARIHDRLAPEILRAFQFNATRIERHIVACYDGETRGHFRAHRDNTTRGTAHRRFAVTLNLNTGEYEGGFLWFPEFGRQRYLAPLGGVVVFSCSLLHEATPVTRGRRYAYLPFLYDEAAARVRQENVRFLGAGEPPAPAETMEGGNLQSFDWSVLESGEPPAAAGGS